MMMIAAAAAAAVVVVVALDACLELDVVLESNDKQTNKQTNKKNTITGAKMSVE